jgi:hypothetical protein
MVEIKTTTEDDGIKDNGRSSIVATYMPSSITRESVIWWPPCGVSWKSAEVDGQWRLYNDAQILRNPPRDVVGF